MIRIDAHDPDGVREVVEILKGGGVVCYPTDTAYGLGVDLTNVDGVRRLFELKGRDAAKPILLLVDSVEMTATVGIPSPEFESIAGKFWPGPLTLVIPARPTLPDRISAGTGTVGVRWPKAQLPLTLLAALGQPVTATSANRSGLPIARTVDEAIDQLGDSLDAVVDAGTLTGSATSTVLDLTTDPPQILRNGQVRYSDLAGFLGGRLVDKPTSDN
jgi:L-threonylcarbamoyladenylate synthase